MQAEVPEDDTYADTDVKGVLCTELRDLEAEICSIDHVLTDSGDLISEYDGIASSWFRNEFVKHDRTYGLLGTYDRISLFL